MNVNVDKERESLDNLKKPVSCTSVSVITSYEKEFDPKFNINRLTACYIIENFHGHRCFTTK